MNPDNVATDLVSIVVPMFNSEATISSTLESVIRQTYTNWECIVINDGSTDSSLEIVSQIAKRENRVHLLSTPNMGVSAARNLGISRSKGSLVALLDSDDYWLPKKLEAQVLTLSESPSLDAVLCGFHIANLNKNRHFDIIRTINPLISNNYAESWLNFEGNGPLLTSTILIRKRALVDVASTGYIFDPSLSTTADVFFYFNLTRFTNIFTVPEPLVIYLLRANQMHLNPDLLLHDYPLILRKVLDLGFSLQLNRCLGNLYIMVSMLYLRNRSIARSIYFLLRSFGHSKTSWFRLPVKILQKRVKGYILRNKFDERIVSL